MSRIGKKPVDLPVGVKAAVANNVITLEGAKGKLSYDIPAKFKVEVKDNKVIVTRPSDEKQDRATHGLIRSLVNNMAIGVSAGYQKDLEIVGVGFKAAVQGKILNIQLSYTHPINFNIPEGITVETPKPTSIIIKGVDKTKVGEVAAKIRGFYRPEPYKGKGIKYVGEHVRRKAGKAVAGAGGGGA
ncbi:MAG: 50S ribosomal protein L6 [Candidatus Omnitrophota bacterium]|nr:50S ribosomal protein L6 [Candidatus Omnitrophota bacterium]